MSKTLDILETAIHGTPSGFAVGCRSRGGCPNHGSRKLLTCADAARAHRHYHALATLPADEQITREMLRNAKQRPFDPPQPPATPDRSEGSR